MPDSFWFGSLQGNWNWNGKISGITYRNIVSYSDGNNEIQMLGRGTEHMISGVTFDNVVIKGQKLGLSSRLLKSISTQKCSKYCEWFTYGDSGWTVWKQCT